MTSVFTDMEKTGKQYKNNNDYLKKAACGDDESTEALIRDNYTLVTSVAKRFTGRGVEFEDLVQIGLMGMLKAIRSFDVERGNAFSTYAVPMITGEIRKYLRDDGLVKVSRARKQNGYSVMREKEKFRLENGREPKISELSERTGLSSEEISDSLDAISPVYSLSALLGESDELTLENSAAAADNPFDTEIEKMALMDTVRTLEPTWRKIIIMRYFKSLSQQETAKRLGMTQVKISREEKKIFAYLREKLKDIS